jgi:peptide/nickel transport system substrate-binding protein
MHAGGGLAMDEQDLRQMLRAVARGRVSRRDFIATMAAFGITAPLAVQMLAHSGIAHAVALPAYKPTKRGGGGLLRLLWWQGPTLLNPHFATGTKDQDGSRLFYEPLASWHPEGVLVPILAAEIPSVENGGLAADGRTVTWKLKKNVQWHDGKPFTADDVVFNWEYVTDPQTAAVTAGGYREITVDKLDTHTVRITFNKPTPLWADAFVGGNGQIIPKHLFAPFKGAKSRDAPANLKPVGTGPYIFVDFKPGDVVRGRMNPDYHEPNRPFFDAVEMKGGGDAVSAARAVLQTGEFDYAWNVLVEDEILKRLEQNGKGRVVIVPSGAIEHIQLNQADPWTEVEGERANARTRHPTLSDPAVRQAISHLVDRKNIEQHIFGRLATATPNFLNRPATFRSPNNTMDFNPDKANRILDAAGWQRGGDGVRAKDGKKLKYVYQTSINAPRQKIQQVVKQSCQRAGIDLELKGVPSSVFFSSDEGNPDTDGKFYADMQMYNVGQGQPDPHFIMNQFVSWEISGKANKWQGRNRTRWKSDEYDRLYREAEVEMDPVKRAALFIRMNDLVVRNNVVIPVLNRNGAGARSNKLHNLLSGWDNTTWLLKDWWREG